MVRRVTEPFKAGDNYWCYNPNGGSVTDSPLPPDGTRYWRCSPGGPSLGNNITVPDTNQFSCGAFHNINTLAAGNHIIQSFYKDTTNLCFVCISPENGKLSLRNAAGAVLMDGVNPIFDNTWFHTGIDYDLHASTGTIRVYRDEILDITYTGNTGFGQTSVNNVAVCRSFLTVIGFNSVSSFYFNDKTGPAPSNGFEGAVRMYQVLPVDDSVISNYIKSTGITAWDLLNNVPPNLLTLIRSSVAGQQQFVVPAAHGLVAPQFIRAVTARWIMSKAGGGRANPGFIFNGSPVIHSSDRNLPISPGIILERKTLNNVGANIALTDTFEVGLTTVIP